MELCEKTVNGFHLLTIFEKASSRQDKEYISSAPIILSLTNKKYKPNKKKGNTER